MINNYKKSNNTYTTTSIEPCFNGLKVDPSLMNEIKRLGGLSQNQEFFIYSMIKKVINYVELGSVKGNRKISFLNISWIGT